MDERMSVVCIMCMHAHHTDKHSYPSCVNIVCCIQKKLNQAHIFTDDFANFLVHPLLQKANLASGVVTFQKKSLVEAGKQRVLFAGDCGDKIVRFSLSQENDGANRKAVVRALGEADMHTYIQYTHTHLHMCASFVCLL
jgi:hypothetical protein